jgi:hypothetical protein
MTTIEMREAADAIIAVTARAWQLVPDRDARELAYRSTGRTYATPAPATRAPRRIGSAAVCTGCDAA